MVELKIEYVSIDSIKPYKNNARHHEEQDVSAIAQSIQEFGFDDPIGVWQDQIVEGHGRHLAAKQLGMETVPIIRLDHLTDEQRRAYALAHNKTAEMSSWDETLLALELSKINLNMEAFGFELPDMAEPEVSEDDFDVQPPEEPKSKRGDLYILGNHRLLCGDATSSEDVQMLLGERQADMLLTDPPYNVDYHGSAGSIMNDNMEDDSFLAFLQDSLQNAKSVMRDGAAFYIWHADGNGHAFRNACVAVGLQVRQVLIWVKNSFVLGRQDYQWKHEPCLYGWKDGAHYFKDTRSESTVFDDKINIKKLKKEEMALLLEQLLSDQISTTVLYENKPLASDLHPTMKPVVLLSKLIKNSTRRGETVLDLFGGSGSTLIACEQLGRSCCMMELDPRFVDVIIARWEQLTGGKAVLYDGTEPSENRGAKV